MNLLDRSLGLVIFSAFFLLSCEEPNEIGLSLNPDDKIGVYFVELPVETSMVYVDSFNTSSGNVIYAGMQSVPDFGTTEATAYTQVSWTATAIRTGAVFDSITFSLDPSVFNGADTNAVQTFTVHRIAPDTSITFKNYYRTSSISYEEQALGGGSFLYRTADDSATTVRDDLFIFHLDNAFGQEIFDYLKDTTAVLEDTTRFYESFRGLVIKGRPENDAVVGFNLNSSGSRVTLHYHTPDTTHQLNLPTFSGINTQQGVVNIVPNFSNITSDRATGTLPSVDSYEEFQANGVIYSHYASGLVPRVNFDVFNAFKDTAGSFVINKAELVVNNVQTASTDLKAPANIGFYLTDESNFVRGVLSGSSDINSPLNFTYDRVNNDYFNDTYYYFSRINDGTIDYNKALIHSFNSSFDYFKVNSGDIKLRIYYTKLKD